jgi:Tfp pilus assembly protein FimT
MELLVVLAAAAVVAASAGPPLSKFRRGYAAWSAGRDLRADLVVARTRAILDGATVRVALDTLRGRYVVVCASGDTLRRRELPTILQLRTTAARQEVLFTARGTSNLYSTSWVGSASDPDVRWHGARVAPTGAVSAM